MSFSILRTTLFASAIGWASAAVADQCDLESYDMGAPPKVIDRTPATGETEFEWASDLDPFDDSGRGWHYIRNLHDRDLSLHWKKPNFVISFEHPLPKDGISCKRDYGAIDSYRKDADAPIYVSGEGEKSAIAYVQSGGRSRQAGASIETNYREADGGVAYGLARLVVRHFAAERLLEIDVDASPEGMRVAFDPSPLGVAPDSLMSALKEAGAEFSVYSSLPAFASFDSLIAQALIANVDTGFLVVSDTPDNTLRLSQIDQAPTGQTPLLLISPEGAVIAATYVDLSSLGAPR
ncbi:hypothetical protein [Mesorhizobium sp.]|uniref:hypothetical protein n=1 Tax=Mesorhizobium sp. TaxID=1871066 RepID=UPI000FE6A170|nr:hypothetical protein [Mesorhizobium sp.]RWK46629.1 MAG: hypothetical protein EOR48_33205 [Mesorhizobium sp.]